MQKNSPKIGGCQERRCITPRILRQGQVSWCWRGDKGGACFRLLLPCVLLTASVWRSKVAQRAMGSITGWSEACLPCGQAHPGWNPWWHSWDSAVWMQQSPSKVLELLKRIKSTIWTLSSLLIGRNSRLERMACSEIKSQRPPGREWRKWPRGAHGARKLVTNEWTQSEELRPFSALLGWCSVSKYRLFFNTIPSLTWIRLLPKMYSCQGWGRTKTPFALSAVLSGAMHSPEHALDQKLPGPSSGEEEGGPRMAVVCRDWLQLPQASKASKQRTACLSAAIRERRLLGRDWTNSQDKRTYRDSEQETE